MVGVTKEKENENMIGQVNRCKMLSSLTKFPQFSIIVGSSGSGKTTLARWIGTELLNCKNIIEIDNKIDSVRQLIDNANKVYDKTLYIIEDGDTMNVSAKNALLKVSEEPKKNTYIILTINNLDNTLATIKSRATIIKMDTYNKDELREYCKEKNIVIDNELINLCDTPNELNILAKDTSIKDYVFKVYDNIEKVSPSNCFKIANEVSLKKDSDGYNLELFWKIFMYCCILNRESDIIKCNDGILITSNYLAKLNNINYNRQFLFDNWILDIRKKWLKY